jgi:hypothetical protein
MTAAIKYKSPPRMSNTSTINSAIDAVIDVWCRTVPPDTPPPEPSNELKYLIKLLKEQNDPEQKVCHLLICKEDKTPRPPPPLNLSGLRNTCSYGLEDFVPYETPQPLVSEGEVHLDDIGPLYMPDTSPTPPSPGSQNKVSDMEAVD